MIIWTEQYNIHTTVLRTVTIVCAWSGGGYKISVNRISLKEKENDLGKAKEKGISLAKRLLTDDLAKLSS